MTDRDVPKRPAGLSGQEEEALRTLEQGYDPDAGALPDSELLVHDDRDHKPGDGPVNLPGGEPEGHGKPDRGRPARPAASAGGNRAGDANPPRPLRDAEKRGILPSDSVAAPPMDRPDDDAAGPANLDPGAGRRRP
ncbi:hypothetical protein AKI39_04770 [Bordetella sp. H567]|uniref:hypothetical protein n=1 Tax=Bordetella sp. H567 TaxID=1697043 RepID=UPI00081D0B15|nr:hypothetical protein [Bordetella sp. H567]AOB30152.1 hypothetical protein AKI39_04770 [Bordetella sp. H567]